MVGTCYSYLFYNNKKNNKIERGEILQWPGNMYIVCILIFGDTMKVNIFFPVPYFHVNGKENIFIY